MYEANRSGIDRGRVQLRTRRSAEGRGAGELVAAPVAAATVARCPATGQVARSERLLFRDVSLGCLSARAHRPLFSSARTSRPLLSSARAYRPTGVAALAHLSPGHKSPGEKGQQWRKREAHLDVAAPAPVCVGGNRRLRIPGEEVGSDSG